MDDELNSRKRRALEFSKRLLALRVDKGYNQSELAIRASAYLPDRRSFSRASISRYEMGENIPGPNTLAALAQALGVEPAELLPRTIGAGQRAPVFLEADSEGHARLSLDIRLPYDLALKIMAMLPSRS
jgi:transcriptional regulator with XRE-family HTH domain